MKLLIFLGVIMGTIIFFILIFLILRAKLKIYISKFGFNSISELRDEISKSSEEFKNNPRHISGMTKLIIPNIVRDFPNFSEKELYNKVETSLLLIFSSLETKKLKYNDELILVKEKLRQQIEDFNNAGISVKYDDVKFHDFAIKYYKNTDGVLNITVETSVEYYYQKKIKDKIKEEYKDYKKQTTYTCEFIYVYNQDKLPKYQTLIGISCPNCGAPLEDLGKKVCKYCHTGLEDINLKSWHIAKYKEGR